MIHSRLSRILSLALAVAATGCTVAPLSGLPSTSAPPSSVPPPPPPPVPVGGGPSPAQPSSQGMQEVLAEIQKAGMLDPATQNQLIRDLQQVDPSLWPQMAMQFRAQLAYAQRSHAPRSDAPLAPPMPPVLPSTSAAVQSAPAPVQQVAYTTPEPAEKRQATPLAAPAVTAAAEAAKKVEKTERQASKSAESEVPRKDVASVAVDKAKSADSAARSTAKNEPPAKASPASAMSKSPAAEKESSSDKDATEDWRRHLKAAIGDMEQEKQAPLPDDEKSNADLQRQVQMRMLNLLAGDRDEAVRPVEASSAATQGFWSEQFFGLSMLLEEPGEGQSSQRRTAEAKKHLSDAVQRLGENCPLVVRNLAFCKRIQSYGCIDQFDSYELSPGQAVLLYAEIENLVSQPTPKGFHTAVKSSYQIFDSRGQRMAEDQFTHTEEYCRNPRRDYFVGYELHLPDRVYSGTYTLQLTVEDLKSHKIGQASVDFTVKEGKEGKETSREKKR